MVSKDILNQYRDLRLEIDEIREEIKKTEDSISELIEEGTVIDKVKGGLGGIQGFKIEGFPQKEYDRRRRILRKKYNRLTEKENDLLELAESIEAIIDEITVSRDRQIFQAIYLKNKTQQQIAKELHIDRSLVSKIISKYM